MCRGPVSVTVEQRSSQSRLETWSPMLWSKYGSSLGRLQFSTLGCGKVGNKLVVGGLFSVCKCHPVDTYY